MSRRRAESPPPPLADNAVVEALGAFCEWFGFSHHLDGRVSFVAPIGDLDGDPLRAIPARLHRALLSPEATAHIVDLHGKRAREAEALLEHLEGDVAIVFFGKGTGVLRGVFSRCIGAQETWVVAGYSGHTAEENVPGVAVLITRALEGRLLEAARAPTAAESARPTPRRSQRETAAGEGVAQRRRRPRVPSPGRRPQVSRLSPGLRRVAMVVAAILIVVFTLPLVAAWFAVLFGYG